ncbi:MAG: hypothetical protein IJV64_06390 [Oscillospiraceae bacterium]|nr:hypothetical protein [Oscillospiraceae bacterium]
MKVSETDYTLVIVTEDGAQHDISDFAEDLGWEENTKELALRMSFTLATDNAEILSIVKIGCVAAVLTNGQERARAIINKAKVRKAGDRDTNTVLAYDELYPLQTSDDHFFFPAGQSTKTVLTQIFNDWGVPLGKYTGADVTHERLVYRTGTVADTVLDILDDAVKKGGPRSILRANQGKVECVERGENETVYLFDEDDTIAAEQTTSITELVTRVKIVGKEDKTTGIPPVEATLNGLTEFGIRQKIYTREKDATTAEAQTAAQAILDEKGKIGKTQSIVAPDVPEMRKGDRIEADLGGISGSYYVIGIQHDADAGQMTLEIEAA